MIDKRKVIISLVREQQRCPLCEKKLDNGNCYNCLVGIEVKPNGIWIKWFPEEDTTDGIED